jgi:DNA-binding NtrC family response regulator
LIQENLELLREKEITEDFWEMICNHDFPGNVRELLNLLKKAGITLDSPITGEKIKSLIQGDLGRESREDMNCVNLDEIKEKLGQGKNFWDLIWKPFINRDLDRMVVKNIIKHFYELNNFSFKKMSAQLNIPDGDYRKFMSLMYKYKIDPRK